MENFAKKFQDMCYRMGLSQTQVAEKLGVGQKTISNWMTGKITPTLPKIRHIADIFDISVEYLLSDSEKIISNKNRNPDTDLEKLLAIRNEIQKVFDSVSNSLDEIDKIINSKKF